MLSALFFLGTLLTLGECGGDSYIGDEGMPTVNVAGVNGVDPTPKPTGPPHFNGVGCGGFSEGVCDASTAEMLHSSTELRHQSESGCADFCSGMAKEHGNGCCQLGGCVDVWSGRQCGAMCFFFEGSKDVPNPTADSGTEYRGKKFERAMCKVSAEEADEAMLDFAAFTSDETALLMARNVCAAVGLSAVLYGAYKFYFGEKN